MAASSWLPAHVAWTLLFRPFFISKNATNAQTHSTTTPPPTAPPITATSMPPLESGGGGIGGGIAGEGGGIDGGGATVTVGKRVVDVTVTPSAAEATVGAAVHAA